MKRSYVSVAGIALLLAASSAISSCGIDNKTEKKEAPKAKSEKTTATLPNYRYVDLDTVLSRYNLAKDYNEEMLRMQNNAESQMKQHEKMQNNGYMTEESYQSDERKMANMQTEAQRSMQNLQGNLAQAAEQAQKTINDSINAFIESYNKTRGYDAIFFKAATLYINPALDITDEVVEGLNARYNKVKK